MNFKDLLRFYGLPEEAKIKLYRHSDEIEFLRRLSRAGKLRDYQAMQANKIFECDFVIFFLGLPGNKGLLSEVCQVQGRMLLNARDIKRRANQTHWWSDPDLTPPRQKSLADPWWQNTNCIYDLVPTDYLAEMKDRLVIDFGNFALASHRWLDKLDPLPIFEIRPEHRAESFPGFPEVRLEYSSLKDIITHPEANQDWYHALSHVAGIYAITVTDETLTGYYDRHRLYIGSASGEKNLWQRWSEYARTGHGNNKHLKALLEHAPRAVNGFQFSVLETAPLTMNRDALLRLEHSYMKRLCTREIGLN